MIKAIQLWNNYINAKSALIEYNLNRSYKSSVADFSEWLVSYIFSGELPENKLEERIDVITSKMKIQVKSISKMSAPNNACILWRVKL